MIINQTKKKLIGVTLFSASLLPSIGQACSISYTTHSENVHELMSIGASIFNGWTFKNYDNICNRLNRNNSNLTISGMVWERGDEVVIQHHISIGDKYSKLSSSDHGIGDIMALTTIKNKAMLSSAFFASINNALDKWYNSGAFNRAVVYFHKNKMTMRNRK